MISIRHQALLPILAVITAVLCLHVISAAPADGASISTDARAAYFDVASDTAVTPSIPLISNRVIARLISYQPYLGPDATSASPREIISEDGLFVEIPYFLENRGNYPDSYMLGLNPLSASDFELTQEVFFIDANDNGRKDSGETELTQPINLLPGERIALILCAHLPPGVSETDRAIIGVSATSNTDPSQTDEENFFSVRLTRSEQVVVRLEASTSQLNTGDKNAWEANLRNDGSTPVLPRPVLMDGSFSNGVLLSVDLTQETTGVDADLDFTSLESSRPSGDTFVYSSDGGITWTVTPPDQDALTHVALFYPNQIAPREEMNFKFCLIFKNSEVSSRYATISATGGYVNQGEASSSVSTSNSVSVNILGTPAISFSLGPQGNVTATGSDDVTCSGGTHDIGVPGPAFTGASYWFPIALHHDGTSDQSFELTSGFLEGFEVELFQQDKVTPLPDGDNDGLFETPLLAANQDHTLWAKVTIAGSVPTQKTPVAIVLRMQEYELGPTVNATEFDITTLCFVGDGTDNIINPQDNWEIGIAFDENAQGTSGSDLALNFNFSELGGYATTNVNITTEYEPWIGPLKDPSNPTQVGDGPFPISFDLFGGGTVQGTVVREEDPNKPGFFRLRLNLPTAAAGIAAAAKVVFTQNGELEDVAPDRILETSAKLTTEQHASASALSDTAILDFNNAILALEKTAVRAEAYIGDPVPFRLKISNLEGTAPISNLRVKDFLPSALHYIEGSAKLDGSTIQTDYDKTTQQISWDLSAVNISVGESVEITYAALLTESSSRTVTNVAVVDAFLGSALQSQDSATIRVRAGSLSRNSILVGRVYWDRDQNGRWGPDDQALPNMTIQLSDGRQVTTDAKGDYHVANVSPGPTALRLVNSSIPEGLELTKPNRLERGTRKVRMIDVKWGEPAKMDFRLEGELVDNESLVPEEPVLTQAPLQDLDPDRMGILSPATGTLYRSRNQFTAEIAYPLTSKAEFFLNGVALGDKYLGNKKVFPKKRRIEQQFVALPLNPGPNTLAVKYKSMRGDAFSDSITVHNVGEVHSVEAVLPPEGFRADGNSLASFDLLVKDRFDQLVGGGQLVEVEIDRGEILNQDFRPDAEGIQLPVKNGVVNLLLSAADHAEERLLKVKINGIQKEIRVRFRPLRTSWEVTGVADFSPTGTKLKTDYSGGDSSHLSLLAQGPLDKAGKWQATLGYDSRRDFEDNFDRGQLNQTENDRYNEFGDDSGLSNPYSSRHPLYLRVESEKHQFLFGDYQTKFEGAELARHSRNLTGAAWRNQFDVGVPLKVEGFVAKNDTNSIIRRIPVSEVVGSIRLQDDRLVLSSEEIVIETYQRNRPDRLLSQVILVRGEDYTIDYITGRIYLKKIFPATDDELNPHVFRISYETESLNAAKLTYGVRMQADLDKVQVGATHYTEQKQAGNFSVTGLDLRYDVTKNLQLHAEVARSSDLEKGVGSAALFGLDYENDTVTSQLQLRVIDENYINRYGSNIQSGKTVLTWNTEYELNESERLSLNLDHESASVDSSHKTLAEAEFIKKFSNQTTFGGKLGYYHEDGSGQEETLSTPILGVKFNSNLGEDFRYQIGAQYAFTEIGYEAPTELDLQIDWLAGENRNLGLRAILRRDEDSSWNPLFQLRAEQQISENLTYASVYGQSSFSSSSPLGFSHALDYRKALKPSLNANFSVESNEFLKGQTDAAGGLYQSSRDYTSFGGGLNWTPAERDLSAHMLIQHVMYPDEKTTNFELEVQGDLSKEWSMIDRLRTSYSDYDGASDQWYFNHKLGVGYRPQINGDWIFLSTLESDLEERGGELSDFSRSNSHALSLESLWSPAELPIEIAMRYTARATDYESDWFFSDLKVLEARLALWNRISLVTGGRWGNVYGSDTNFWNYNMGLIYAIREDFEFEFGYNFSDEESSAFRADSFDSEGVYMQFRMVLDEDWLRRFKIKK